MKVSTVCEDGRRALDFRGQPLSDIVYIYHFDVGGLVIGLKFSQDFKHAQAMGARFAVIELHTSDDSDDKIK